MAAEKKAATPTSYLVFKQNGFDSDGLWGNVGDANATSAAAAIRAVVSNLRAEDQAGTFTAVPARSWKRVTVKPQTTIRLELTEAKP